jgi:hypothetical protein
VVLTASQTRIHLLKKASITTDRNHLFQPDTVSVDIVLDPREGWKRCGASKCSLADGSIISNSDSISAWEAIFKNRLLQFESSDLQIKASAGGGFKRLESISAEAQRLPRRYTWARLLYPLSPMNRCEPRTEDIHGSHSQEPLLPEVQASCRGA